MRETRNNQLPRILTTSRHISPGTVGPISRQRPSSQPQSILREQVGYVTHADICTTDVTLGRHAVLPHPNTSPSRLSSQFHANVRPYNLNKYVEAFITVQKSA
ncbi:hypothetical protein J6590_105424, partial [Homalodisca vitripennis]